MSEIDNTALIEAYLNQALGSTERADFENRLLVENELQKELSLHQQIRGFVIENEVTHLKSQVKNWLKEDEQIEKPKIFAFPNLIRIAASVAIIAGLGWYFLMNDASKVANEQQYLSELISQNPGTLQGTDARSKWVASFQAKNYQAVIDTLEKNTARTPEEEYHLGLAYTATKNYPKAIESFSSKMVQDSVYAEKATWAIALIYVKQNEKEKAKELLEKIANSNSEFSEKARKLLK